MSGAKRSWFHRLVVVQGRDDLMIFRQGPLRTGEVQFVPSRPLAPPARTEPELFAVLVADTMHWEQGNASGTHHFLNDLRITLARKQIRCSRIARSGPAGTLGFLAYCQDGSEVETVRRAVADQHLMRFTTRTERLVPPIHEVG